MLNVQLDETNGIAVFEPAGELSETDFAAAAAILDPYIHCSGALKGLVIQVRTFPGWDSFSALLAHLKFAKDHHKQIARLALATDSPVGQFAERVGSHFVSAEIKHFKFSESAAAQQWACDAPPP